MVHGYEPFKPSSARRFTDSSFIEGSRTPQQGILEAVNKMSIALSMLWRAEDQQGSETRTNRRMR